MAGRTKFSILRNRLSKAALARVVAKEAALEKEIVKNDKPHSDIPDESPME
jgi:hypothetical protein